MVVLTDRLKRQIGQHFVVGFTGYDFEGGSAIDDLIRNYYVGSVILAKRNIKSFAQVHALVQKLQRVAKDTGHERPLLVGIDQENGSVSSFASTGENDVGTQFPGAMALAATTRPDLAKEVSVATAKELRLAGINWCYSPVADINSNPSNPVIGVRSFGDDTEIVSAFSVAVAAGLYTSKVAPCAKHFPGHGDTDTDSHLALPIINKDISALQSTELVPFVTLIREHVASVMTAHIALPLIVGDNTPASLSRKVTTEILRREMGYTGLVTTDCLEMDAVAATYGTEKAAVMSLQAGADIAMICHTYDRQVGAIKAVYNAVESGTLPLDEVNESTVRIWNLKDEFTGTWDDVTSGAFNNDLTMSLLKTNATLSANAYASSVTWFDPQRTFASVSREESVTIFLPQLQRINPAIDDPDEFQRVASVARKDSICDGYRALFDEISGATKGCEMFVYSPEDTEGVSLQDDVLSALATSDKVVFVTRNAYQALWQLTFLRNIVTNFAPDQIVVVSSCGPYDLSCTEASGLALSCLCTFEFTKPAMESVSRVILGRAGAPGSMPVKVAYQL